MHLASGNSVCMCEFVYAKSINKFLYNMSK